MSNERERERLTKSMDIRSWLDLLLCACLPSREGGWFELDIWRWNLRSNCWVSECEDGFWAQMGDEDALDVNHQKKFCRLVVWTCRGNFFRKQLGRLGIMAEIWGLSSSVMDADGFMVLYLRLKTLKGFFGRLSNLLEFGSCAPLKCPLCCCWEALKDFRTTNGVRKMEFNVGAVVGQTRLIVAGCNGGTLHCKVNSLSSSTAELSLSFSSLGRNRSYSSLPLSKQASGCRRYRRTSGRRRWTSLEPSITTKRSAVLFALKDTAAESFSGAAEEEAVEEGLISDQDIEVTEVLLRGEDTEVREISNSLYSFKTLKKLVFKLGEGGKKFVVDSVSGVLRMGKKSSDDEHPELLAFGTSMYENKDGMTALHQWTATEMTMQHAQLVRIERDINYLVFAFSFFGWVRICEAVVHAFSAHPPKLKRLMQASNAMDPLTVAWLAYNLRKPIAGLVLADPTDLQKLAQLKGKLWEELHAFFERQWKVVSTKICS